MNFWRVIIGLSWLSQAFLRCGMEVSIFLEETIPDRVIIIPFFDLSSLCPWQYCFRRVIFRDGSLQQWLFFQVLQRFNLNKSREVVFGRACGSDEETQVLFDTL